MASYVGQGNQIVNFNFGEDILSELMNYFLKNIFVTPGVIYSQIDVVDSANGTIVIRKGTSFLITPYNKTDILVKVDLTEDTSNTIQFAPSDTYLIARYNYEENDNSYVDFLTVDIAGEHDVVLAEGIWSGGNLTLNFDVQQKVTVNNILLGADSGSGCTIIANSNANSVQGYTPGYNSGNVPLKNNPSIMNNNLNAEYLGDGVDKFKPSHNADSLAIADNIKNNNLNVKGIGDGSHSISINEVAINDGTLQNNLNAELLDNYDINYLALKNPKHTHNYDQAEDDATYKKMLATDITTDHRIKTSGIEDDILVLRKINSTIFYNHDNSESFVPFIQYDTMWAAAPYRSYDINSGTFAVSYNSTPLVFINNGGENSLDNSSINVLSIHMGVCNDGKAYLCSGDPHSQVILFGKIS